MKSQDHQHSDKNPNLIYAYVHWDQFLRYVFPWEEKCPKKKIMEICGP